MITVSSQDYKVYLDKQKKNTTTSLLSATVLYHTILKLQQKYKFSGKKYDGLAFWIQKKYKLHI